MSSGFGPGFQGSGSRLYRSEYAAATLAIVAYLIWRAAYAGGIDWLFVVFWAVFPDLVAFIPIGVSSERREWPRWGARLYNASHTVLVWGAAFLVSWYFLGTPYWPLLGWLLHITTDRTFGYGLRVSR